MTNDPAWTLDVYAADADALQALGARLAGWLDAGDVLLLEGDLGAGKTTLARGIVTALSGETEVPSPTYTLVQTYDAEPMGRGAFEIWHADLYRLDAPADILPLGLMDVRDEVLSLIEWPGRMGDYRPLDALRVDIGFDGVGRRVVFTPPEHTEWRARLEAGLGR